MSLITSLLGIDPLIANARKRRWHAVLGNVSDLLRRYASTSVAADFDTVRAAIEASGAVKADPS